MKKYVVIGVVFLAGAAAAFVFLSKKETLNFVTANTKVWIENKPLISSESHVSDLSIFVKIAEKFKSTVVHINTTQTVKMTNPFQFQGQGGDDEFFRRFFDEFFGGTPQQMPKDQKQKGLGSGFIISEDGYIITNNHVVEDADEIKVKLTDTEKESFDAKLIGADKFTDVALIKIDTKGNRKSNKS